MTSGFGKEAALKTKELMNIIGHPLHVLTLENHEIIKLVEEIEIILKEQQNICSVLNQLEKLTTIAQHYGKKDELMFPLLKDKYTYPGPSDVMWGVEDEIRADLRKIITDVNEKSQNIAQNNSQETAKDNSFVDELQNLIRVLSRIREMIYKEENILFPLCAGCFTDEEWIAIAKDFPMFGACMIQDIPLWDKVKEAEAMAKSMINSEIGAEEGTVKLPGGSFNLTQLRAMLNTLPMEITLIDENDTNLFFNEGEKLFTRPMMALGRPVYSCHPKRVEPMVRMLIHDFKTGKKDSMHIMSEKCGRQVLINYYALRDDNGTYLGTLEAVQEMDGIADAIKKGKKGPIKL